METKKYPARVTLALISALIVCVFAVGMSFAADDEVIPNFTALKIGTVVGNVDDGNIKATGIITASTAIRTPAIIPTSTEIEIGGDLSVTGALVADSIGYFYVRTTDYGNEVSTSGAEGSSLVWTTTASCEVDDQIISCIGGPSSDYWYRNSISDNSCITMSLYNELYAQAICYSSDAEVESSTTTASHEFAATWWNDNQSYMTMDIADALVNDPIYGFTDSITDIILGSADVMADFAAEVETTMGDYLTDNGYATQTWVTGKSYATQTWVGSRGYATQTSVNSLTTTVTSLSSSISTLQSSVTTINGKLGIR
ncbi:MAG: hypothetical protein UV80_C0002G0136 [Candidatus Peregrinibacteria bacterium GW2011_GWF2_43_17]|nr:MAG: hypothetical protein UV80_C0002G0136 [Candidatus Peregrinibacteria bacterium GW2011_GWF2_43_17]HAU39820.1 hypothetical protein [Candidatus Peregrinibacteria bacterium]